MAKQPQAIHWFALLALAVMWGSAFALIEIALHDFSPLQITAGRLLMAAIVLYLLMRRAGLQLPRARGDWLMFFAVGISGNALPFFLTSFGQQTVDSGMAGLLMATTPLFVVVLAHFFVPSEPLTFGRIAGFLLGFAGMAVLFGWSGDAGQPSSLGGQLSLLGAAFLFAATAMLVLRAKPYPLLVFSCSVMITSSVLTVAMALYSGEGDWLAWSSASWSSLVAVAGLGVFVTGLPALVYFFLVTEAGAGFQAQTNFLMPIWALILGSLAFGETLEPTTYAAIALIFSGIFVAKRYGASSPVLFLWPYATERKK
ncbi:MAG: DMT family transporter [Pseudomonadota bacterium]